MKTKTATKANTKAKTKSPRVGTDPGAKAGSWTIYTAWNKAASQDQPAQELIDWKAKYERCAKLLKQTEAERDQAYYHLGKAGGYIPTNV